MMAKGTVSMRYQLFFLSAKTEAKGPDSQKMPMIPAAQVRHWTAPSVHRSMPSAIPQDLLTACQKLPAACQRPLAPKQAASSPTQQKKDSLKSHRSLVITSSRAAASSFFSVCARNRAMTRPTRSTWPHRA